MSVGKYMAKHDNGQLAVPAIVPLVDSLLCPTEVGANCEVYTCVEKEFSSERKTSVVRSAALSWKSHRRVVVCAARDVEAGERLSLGLCGGIDNPTCVLRFGQVKPTAEATGGDVQPAVEAAEQADDPDPVDSGE
jgi:hypothetical protein